MSVASIGGTGYRQLSWPTLVLSWNLRGRSEVNHGTYQTLGAIPKKILNLCNKTPDCCNDRDLESGCNTEEERVGKASLLSRGHLLLSLRHAQVCGFVTANN
jgi:hypothetical protein